MTIDNEILAAVVDQLNTIEGLPCEISLKELSLDAPALFLHQTGGEKSNQTVGGSFDMSVQLELVYRTSSNSEAEIITATALLDTLIAGQLDTWTKEHILPELDNNREALGYEVTSRSSVIDTDQDGTLVHSFTFVFNYYQDVIW